MGITTNHVSVDELNRLHEKFASAFRVAGLRGDQLDAAIAAAMTPSLKEIEDGSHRRRPIGDRE